MRDTFVTVVLPVSGFCYFFQCLSLYSVSSPSTVHSVFSLLNHSCSQELSPHWASPRTPISSSGYKPRRLMVLQENGWPLGLRPLNGRIGLVRNRDLSGSISFSTLLTGSPSSTADSSSDLDTESTGSFFHEKSITLGSLIGVSSILELSRRSTRRIRTAETLRDQKNCKSKPWFFSLCSKLSIDTVDKNDPPSLGHFLQAERRAANVHRREIPMLYGPNDFSPILPNSDLNSLFVGGQIAPQSNSSMEEDGGRRSNTESLEQGNGSFETPG